MLHAAAMLCGLVILWMLGAQHWSSPQAWLIAAGVSVACVAVALRFGGVGAAFSHAPRDLLVALSRAGAVMRGATSTIRKAISADVMLNPALIRIRTRASRARDRAAFAGMITAMPGMAVVETDVDGLLVHVLDEASVDPEDLGRLERSVAPGAAP